MKSFTGKFSSVRGWAPLLALLLGAGMMISACGDEEVPAPTTPAPPPPAPAPAPTPPPEPTPEPTSPATPENLRVSGTTSTSITWMWDAVEGALGYQGQFSTDSTFTDADPTFIIIAPATSHTVSNLSGNMPGQFRVRSGAGTSITDLTYSDWTEGVSGTTDTPPAATALAAPGGLNAGSAEDDSITLAWNEVDDAESYEVEQRAEDAVNYSPASCDGEGNVVEETTCTVTDLDSGTSYDFRVRGLPADDDDAHVAGAWGTTSGTTTGRGPATTTVTPGGMGMANVRWHNGGDSNAVITFVWDREGDAMYETYVLEDPADIHDDDPCENVADMDSADTPRYASRGSATSQDITTTAPGTVRGLCVRAEGSSGASFAWGISPPEEPDNGTPDIDKDKTVELMWTDVDLKEAFDYEIHLAADPERPAGANKIDATSEATSRDVQAACDAGALVDRFTPDIDLSDRTVTVDSGLNPHTGYLLCIRASNTAGVGSWAVPIANDDATGYGTSDHVALELYTRPTAPPSLQSDGYESTDATGSDNERLAPAWEIGTRSVTNVPRNASDFNVSVFFQDERKAATLKVADCSVDTAPEGYDIVAESTLTVEDGLSGFTVQVPAGSAIERLGYTRKVYLCAQGDSTDGAKVGTGPGPWTISSVLNVTKPSTSLSTDSDSVTDTEATITIRGWNNVWWYKTNADGADCVSVAAGTDEATLSSLTAITSYSVAAWDADTCDSATSTRLGTTSFRTKATS